MNKEEQIKNDIKFAVYILDHNIYKGFISKQDIYNWFEIPSYEVLGYKKKDLDTQSKKLLFSLYFKPYILYYSKYLDEDMLSHLTPFIKQRFLEEKSYLDDKSSYQEIGKNEYKELVEDLELKYIYSSPYGKNIFRNMEDSYSR